MGQFVRRAILKDNLRYSFDGANLIMRKDANTIRDVVEHRELLLENGTTFSDKGIVFDGVDDQVNVAGSPLNQITLKAADRPYTLSTWVQEERNIFNSYIISRSSGASVISMTRNSALVASNEVVVNCLSGLIKGGSGNGSIPAIVPYNQGDWMNIVYTAPSDVLDAEMFINGIKVADVSDSINPITQYGTDSVNNIWVLGRLQLNAFNQYTLQGTLGLTTIHSAVLTPEQILYNYEVQKHRYL